MLRHRPQVQALLIRCIQGSKGPILFHKGYARSDEHQIEQNEADRDDAWNVHMSVALRFMYC